MIDRFSHIIIRIGDKIRMENITIKLLTRYKSLQEGFEWKDIPSFSVITGVNGVGKSQLLEVIKGRSEKPDSFGNFSRIVRKISSKYGPENLIFSDNIAQRGLSLNGLIEYVKNMDSNIFYVVDLC